jgi:hypothetical protein
MAHRRGPRGWPVRRPHRRRRSRRRTRRGRTRASCAPAQCAAAIRPRNRGPGTCTHH